MAGVLLALFLSLTNIRFVLRDTDYYGQDIVQTGMHRPYLRPGEIAALDWIDQHVPRNLAVQPLPYLKLYHQNDRTQFGPTDMSLACLTPGLTDHHVYCGHWGETPDYRGKLQELVHFTLPVTTDVQRQALLRKMNVHYLIYSQKVQPDEDADRLAPMFRGLILPPSYLHLVYSNPDADIYRIDETVLNAK